MTDRQHDAVLFIGYGGPEKREDVIPFLERIAEGRRIPSERLQEVAHHYEAIARHYFSAGPPKTQWRGGASPLNEMTRRQAAALQRELARQGVRPLPNMGSGPLPVYVGQRNWHPFLEDVLRQMAEDGVRRAVGFIAAPHRCEASYDRYIRAVDEAVQRINRDSASPHPSPAGRGRRSPGEATALVVNYTKPWFDHPLFIEAIANRVKETTCQEASWIFVVHSIPIVMAEKSNYVQQVRRTAELVAERCGQTKWSLAYSSRSGPPGEKWLEPDVLETIRRVAAEGASEILLVPIGFVAENVETLYDLDMETKEAADRVGVRLVRAQTVGDHPIFVRMMAEVIQR
jgi:protoporphyrin/coproporphyrin ferrochelatase